MPLSPRPLRLSHCQLLQPGDVATFLPSLSGLTRLHLGGLSLHTDDVT